MTIWAEVREEIARARSVHKEFPANPERALVLLVEEVGEAARAIQQAKWGKMRKELVEVAATAVQWLEKLGPGEEEMDEGQDG